jgi:redox-sensitive bicupin YhaK (pirin superfamily)
MRTYPDEMGAWAERMRTYPGETGVRVERTGTWPGETDFPADASKRSPPRPPTMSDRNVTRIVTAQRQSEGGGFIVRRPFPTQGLPLVDPFLLLDEMGPAQYGPGEAVGAPDHPHRGFETVTYMLEGEFEHEDSAGNRGKLGPGDVQWMTAGAGVVHSEMPSARIRQQGGRVHGFQIWVNLPARDKMSKPHYQEVPAARIPEARTDDGLAIVRVIAGEALGARAVIETRTPIVYLDWTLSPGASTIATLPRDHDAFAFVFQGAALVGDGATVVSDGQLAILGGGDRVTIACAAGAEQRTRLLLLGGVPLREPVARYGPFVMNTEAEIQAAIRDYRSGRLGEIARV